MHTINILSDDILMVVMQVIYSMSIGIVFAGLIYKKQGIHMCVFSNCNAFKTEYIETTMRG